MKVLVIPDKFKGSLTAGEVIASICKGVRCIYPKAMIHEIQASDGGDGFLESVLANIPCELVKVPTTDPLGRDIQSEYLFNSEDNSAYIELAKASGLALLKDAERNVMKTSTIGTGLLIKDAILRGCTSIYIGLGGSATNDIGLGIAAALGYYFLDNDGNQLEPTGENLSNVNSIHKKSNSLSLKNISFFAVNDVGNPLYGPSGAAHTYAKQKGASDQEIQVLDFGMQDFANLVKLQIKKDVADLPGAGAAGGTAYGLQVFCDATFVSGIEFILKISEVDMLLSQEKIDYIITGEGKLDDQTLHGKLIKGVLDLGKRHDIPVIAVCGQSTLEEGVLERINIDAVLEIKDASRSVDYAMQHAGTLVEEKIASFFKNGKP